MVASPIPIRSACVTRRVNRNISQLVSGERSTFAELDSHADTCVFGKDALVLTRHSQVYDVHGFHPELGSVQQVPGADVVVAFDIPHTQETFMLIFNQVLYCEEVRGALIPPFQLRSNDIIVNDVPRQHLADPKEDSHSIVVDGLIIPLVLNGVWSAFQFRKPSLAEFEATDRHYVVSMTSETEWDPYSEVWAEREDELKPSIDYSQYKTTMDYTVDSVSARCLASVSHALPDETFIPEIRKRHKRTYDDLVRETKALQGKNKRYSIDATTLSKRWGIPLHIAKSTLDATTQRGVRDFTKSKGTKRLRARDEQFRYKSLDMTLFADTLQGPCKSLNGNKHATIFASDNGFCFADPIESTKQVGESLQLMHERYGTPRVMRPDNAPVFVGKNCDFARKSKKTGTYLKPIEPHTQWHNLAEAAIRELERKYRQLKARTNSPKAVWDHLISYCALILTHTARSYHSLEKQVPQTVMNGDTADISFLVEFDWYQWVWFTPPTIVTTPKLTVQEGEHEGKKYDDGYDGPDKHEKRQLGRYLGPSLAVGDEMCSKVLTRNGRVAIRSSVYPLSNNDLLNENIKRRMDDWNESLKSFLKDRFAPSTAEEDEVLTAYDTEEKAEPVTVETVSEDDDDDDPPIEPIPEADDIDHHIFDKLLRAQVILPKGDENLMGRVVRRKRDANGNLIGRQDENPLLSTAMYEIEFADGTVEPYAANKIAEHIWSQVDDYGHDVIVLDEIIDHDIDAEVALKPDEAWVNPGQGNRRRVPTTKGHKLYVRWKDGTMHWEHLKDMKHWYPIETAEYAMAAGIADEPAYAWWVPYTLKKRDRIVHAQASRYARTTHKFGIELPRTVEQALELDRKTGTTHWQEAIKKEMDTVGIAFKVTEDSGNKPIPGHTRITCHLVFDVKMDFTRKARFVANGSMTEAEGSITYSSVVSRESVRIAFMLAALNGLEVMSADLKGAYLHAPCREKICFKAGPELGSDCGKWCIVTRALYGLKSSGASWRAMFASTIEELGFIRNPQDPDLYVRPRTRDNGDDYYEILLVYVDDLLLVDMDPRKSLEQILRKGNYDLKPGSDEEPKIYLGGNIGKHMFEGDPIPKWTCSAEKYLSNVLENAKNYLEPKGIVIHEKKNVLPPEYHPELDESPYLDEDDATWYSQQVGILQWTVELGRVDICTETNVLSSFRAAPRRGHMEAVVHVLGWLKKHRLSKLVFDDSPPDIAEDIREFRPEEWKDFYDNVKEEIPHGCPEPRGPPVSQLVYVDADLAGCHATRRSRTGILMFLNRAPVDWMSKRQPRVRPSTYASELMALKIATEKVEAQRLKLRWMGVRLDGPAEIRCDNQSVVFSASRPESALKKKTECINYHYVRERAAMGIIQVYYVKSEDNLADILTKLQPGTKRIGLCKNFMFK